MAGLSNIPPIITEKDLNKIKNKIVQKTSSMKREDAWDILQDSLILLWRNIEKLDPVYPFYPYLKKIYTNECYKMLNKRKKNAPNLSLDYEYEDENSMEIGDYSYNPDTIINDNEFKEKVKRAMDSLPEHYRTTLWLRVGEGSSYEEISKLLNINIGTVKSRINMARKMILKKLNEYREEG